MNVDHSGGIKAFFSGLGSIGDWINKAIDGLSERSTTEMTKPHGSHDDKMTAFLRRSEEPEIAYRHYGNKGEKKPFYSDTARYDDPFVENAKSEGKRPPGTRVDEQRFDEVPTKKSDFQWLWDNFSFASFFKGLFK